MPSECERVPVALRRTVASRANHLCEYCRCPEEFSPDSFTVEHIKPRQAGGETIAENLAWSCFGCNSRKHTKTSHCDPQTQQEVALFHPRQQVWSEHFSWNDDFTEVIGKTPYGRATVEALKLNRVGVVNLRRLLTSAGLHPPKSESHSLDLERSLSITDEESDRPTSNSDRTLRETVSQQKKCDRFLNLGWIGCWRMQPCLNPKSSGCSDRIILWIACIV